MVNTKMPFDIWTTMKNNIFLNFECDVYFFFNFTLSDHPGPIGENKKITNGTNGFDKTIGLKKKKRMEKLIRIT